MEDEDTHGKKMARKGRTEVIYKGTFVSKRSLVLCWIRLTFTAKAGFVSAIDLALAAFAAAALRP